MSETLLLLLLIALSLNFVLGLWFAFKPQVLPKKEKEPVKVIEVKEEKEEVVWEPGWVARAGPPPFQSEARNTDVEPFAYVKPMAYAPLV